MGKSVGLLAFAVLAGSVVIPSSEHTLASIPAAGLLGGCFKETCLGAVEEVYMAQGQGRFLDDDTWESVPLNGTWHNFGPSDVVVYFPGFSDGRPAYDTAVYLSASSTPLQNGSNYTVGAGNIALITRFDFAPDRVQVTNGTCSQYYIRVLIKAGPGSADAGAPDAGDADGGTSDGGELSDASDLPDTADAN